MSKLFIRKFPDIALLTTCSKVEKFDSSLHKTLDDMAVLMKQSHGMGLAANQVGINKSFFIMTDSRGSTVEFINPEIIEKEGEADLPEGCLSLPNYFIKCNRASSVSVKAQNRTGEEFKVMAEGIEAVCIQHEYDHLLGIFYINKEKK